MFTSHGHHIPGTILDDTDDNQRNIARCGGPGLCNECSVEAVRASNSQVTNAEYYEHQFLLDIAPHIEHATSNFILFEYREIDTGFVRRSLMMPRQEWSEMGCPMRIMVAIHG